MLSQYKKTIDATVRGEMADLCQKLTHTGEKELNQSDLKKFEIMCKQSELYMDHAHSLLIGHLTKKHSEIRYGALLVCDYLFRNHSYFRHKVIEDLQDFMKYTVGTRKEHPLPPPKTAADALRKQALKAISDWYHEFKLWHVELESAYEYLKNCLKIDFKSIEQQRLMEIKKERDEKKRLELKEKEKLLKTLDEIQENIEDITATVAAMNSCMTLLLPPPEEFFVPEVKNNKVEVDHEMEENCNELDLREYGVIDPKQTVTFTLSSESAKLKVNRDNYPIVESAKDVYKQLLKQYLPKVKSWVKVLKNVAGKQGQLKAASELLEQIEIAVRQYNELGIQDISYKPQSDDSDDTDMEEVSTKEGYETEVKDAMLAEMIRAHVEKREEEKRMKSSLTHQPIRSISPQPGPSKLKSKPKEKLPTNIEEWEHKDIPKPHIVVGMKLDNHQVWLSSSALETEEVQIPTLSSCAVEYTTSFEPVKWTCRALLPSGKLCPRKDRVKCPLHGPIVPRDNQGKCSRAEDSKAEAEREEQHKRDNPDWQDPKLLEEIKKNTGIDLKMPEKGKRKKKPSQFPGLTDLKKKKETPQTRLAKKIFKRGDLKRLMPVSMKTTTGEHTGVDIHFDNESE